jgi:hypothetical protein
VFLLTSLQAQNDPVFNRIIKYYSERKAQSEADRTKLLTLLNASLSNAQNLFTPKQVNQLTAYQRSLELELGIVDPQKAGGRC